MGRGLPRAHFVELHVLDLDVSSVRSIMGMRLAQLVTRQGTRPAWQLARLTGRARSLRCRLLAERRSLRQRVVSHRRDDCYQEAQETLLQGVHELGALIALAESVLQAWRRNEIVQRAIVEIDLDPAERGAA